MRKLAGIQTGIELQDHLSDILHGIVNTVNLAVSSMYDMQEAMNADVDVSSLEYARNEINQVGAALAELNERMSESVTPTSDAPIVPDAPAPIEVPVQWNTDGLEVFTSTGIERFEQEVQSTNDMLNALNNTQAQIQQTASTLDILPNSAVQDMNGMGQRLQGIQERIQAIESNPLNMGSDVANTELEHLRAQLDRALQEQCNLNAAMDSMDVSAANEAYLRLSQIVGGTERYIRDNVDEQGRFRREIEQSTDSASDLNSMIAKAAGAFAGIFGISQVKDFASDCMDLFGTQLNAEKQLMSVLGNMLDDDYVADYMVETTATADTSEAIDEINAIQDSVDDVDITVSARTEALQAEFDAITAKASEIQGRGIYGDEAMIAGAAELSTYFTDTNATEMMMDTLANYAMGMSGGGELDSTAMVDYATGLGKIMTGSYEAMTKKGFEFTDAQKAIIEGGATEEQIAAQLGAEYVSMSEDMQAAAVITQVIDESWAGLYETMSDTPQGKIIQMTNAWGDMKEVIGGQLYPYVLLFVGAITSHWGTIQTVIDGITIGLQTVMGVLSWLLDGALNFAQAVIDNWSWISPIIYGVIAALAAYVIYLGIVKGIELASAAAGAAMAVGKGLLAAATMIATGATWAQTTAQMGLNGAMYACPIVWIIILIIALIALFYAAVGAINHFAGTSISATGTLCGAFMVALAFIGNIFVALWNLVVDVFVLIYNLVATVANFIGNVFDDPIGAIARLFFDLADTVLGILQALASAIDSIFGSNLAGAVQGWRDSLGGWVDDTFGEGEEIMEKMNADDLKLDRFEYGAAWDAGYSFGEGIDESIANFDPSSLFGTDDIPSPEDYAPSYDFDNTGTAGDINDIAGNTGNIADAMDITQEDLKYLRDIAEQEAINKYTTAEIKVDMSGMQNTVNSGDDIDGFVSKLTDSVNEAIGNMTEGVHK